MRENRTGVYIRISEHHEEKLDLLKEILLSHPGDVPIYLFYERNKKLMALPVGKYGIVQSEECFGQIRRVFGENAVYMKTIEA
jgi:DNA polymerase-3 subunit alpha